MQDRQVGPPVQLSDCLCIGDALRVAGSADAAALTVPK